MKKTLIAMTIILTGSFALSVQAKIKFSGTIQQALRVHYSDSERSISDTREYNNFYLQASEDLGSGMTISGVYGFGIVGGGVAKVDDTQPKLTLSGGFGSVTIGQNLATPVKNVASVGSWTSGDTLGNPRENALAWARTASAGITYSTPILEGLSLGVAFLNNTVSDAKYTGSKTNTAGNIGIKIAYANKIGISVAFALNNTEVDGTSLKDSNNLSAGTKNVKKSYTAFSLGYDAGIVVVNFVMANGTVNGESTNGTGDLVKRSATYIDISVPFGDEEKFHLGLGSYQDTMLDKTKANKASIFGIEYVYMISKSLNLFASHQTMSVKDTNKSNYFGIPEDEYKSTLGFGLAYSF